MKLTTWSAKSSSSSRSDARAAGGRRARAVPVEHLLRHRLHLGEAGVDTDRSGAGEAQLDAVVARGIVRRGEHRAGHVEHAGRVVHQVGRGEPDVDDVDALVEHAAGERIDQRRPRRAHVAADDDLVGTDEGGEADSEGMGHVSIELIGDRAADVVRLDDGIEDRHDRREAIGRRPAGAACGVMDVAAGRPEAHLPQLGRSLA